MKLPSMTLVFLLLTAGIAHCQESSKKGNGDKGASIQTQFMVTLAEYHLEKQIPVDATEAEILKIIRSAGTAPFETIRMTASENTESMVNFGKSITVTTGRISRGPTTTRQTETMQIGTILNARIAEHANGAIAEIDYTTSRLNGEGTEDSPPDLDTNTAQATQIYAIGEPRLLSTWGTDKVTCIVVTIQRIP